MRNNSTARKQTLSVPQRYSYGTDRGTIEGELVFNGADQNVIKLGSGALYAEIAVANTPTGLNNGTAVHRIQLTANIGDLTHAVAINTVTINGEEAAGEPWTREEDVVNNRFVFTWEFPTRLVTLSRAEFEFNVEWCSNLECAVVDPKVVINPSTYDIPA